MIAIDVFFVAGLGVLLFMGGGLEMVPIVACIGMIAYVTVSILRLRAKDRAPK